MNKLCELIGIPLLDHIIVGGGYIGMEMAENLKKAGLSVTIVEKADHLIAPLDFDMAVDVHRYAKDEGINLILNKMCIRDRPGSTGTGCAIIYFS